MIIPLNYSLYWNGQWSVLRTVRYVPMLNELYTTRTFLILLQNVCMHILRNLQLSSPWAGTDPCHARFGLLVGVHGEVVGGDGRGGALTGVQLATTRWVHRQRHRRRRLQVGMLHRNGRNPTVDTGMSLRGEDVVLLHGRGRGQEGSRFWNIIGRLETRVSIEWRKNIFGSRWLTTDPADGRIHWLVLQTDRPAALISAWICSISFSRSESELLSFELTLLAIRIMSSMDCTGLAFCFRLPGFMVARPFFSVTFPGSQSRRRSRIYYKENEKNTFQMFACTLLIGNKQVCAIKQMLDFYCILVDQSLSS